ncbi:hypothetical protein CALCODRAFT_344209 [Calocera cornea HHB12733]|uniref:GDP-fucose protein O-fucosyltransferase 2 n=1 Tax=Calocera cornea HHB12733 TaxID=1353952 RepID=A0A165EW08_9BASI|nr:hypothetical protein CALCODRAFT_344209 [Calocera cornea HHB12733]
MPTKGKQGTLYQQLSVYSAEDTSLYTDGETSGTAEEGTHDRSSAWPNENLADSRTSTKQANTRQRRIRTRVVLLWLVLVVCAGAALSGMRYMDPPTRSVGPERVSAWLGDSSPHVQGEITDRYKDRLKTDTKYVTGFTDAGFTNQIYGYLSLLYLAWYTDRVAIMPPFVPGPHLNHSAGQIAFGDVFDLDRLRKQVKLDIVEWRDLKNVEPTQNAALAKEWEDIGCWSALTAGGTTHIPSPASDFLKLDVSYTYLDPDRYRLDGQRLYTDILKLAHLGYPSERTWALSQNLTQPSLRYKNFTEPDDQLMCFDTLFYATVDSVEHWSQDWDPVWNKIGQYLTWNPEIELLAKRYLNRLFGLPDDGPTPPYIGLHLRRGDMSGYCYAGKGSCMPTNEMAAAAIEELQERLEAKGLSTPHVFVSSDETDPAWWAAIHERGWHYIDHGRERTCERYGCWYTVLLDSAIHSLADGFVGTDHSTLSVVASKRVQSWKDGPVTFLQWSRSKTTVPPPVENVRPGVRER